MTKLLYPKMKLELMNAACEQLGLKPSNTAVATAGVLSRHFKENTKKEDVSTCSTCQGKSDFNLPSCPYCGDGGKVTPGENGESIIVTDDSPEAVTALAAGPGGAPPKAKRASAEPRARRRRRRGHMQPSPIERLLRTASKQPPATELKFVAVAKLSASEPDGTGADVATLAESIRRVGLLHPLQVARSEDGTYRVLAGRRRLLALKTIEARTAPVFIVELDEKRERFVELDENLERRELTSAERVKLRAHQKRLIEELHPGTKPEARKAAGRKAGGATAGRGRPKAPGQVGRKQSPEQRSSTALAAAATGTSERTTRRATRIMAGASLKVQAAFSAEELTQAHAEELSRLEQHADQDEILGMVHGKLTAKATADLVRERLAERRGESPELVGRKLMVGELESSAIRTAELARTLAEKIEACDFAGLDTTKMMLGISSCREQLDRVAKLVGAPS